MIIDRKKRPAHGQQADVAGKTHYFYAERQGFEPWEPVKAQQFSRLSYSTALAPLQYFIQF